MKNTSHVVGFLLVGALLLSGVPGQSLSIAGTSSTSVMSLMRAPSDTKGSIRTFVLRLFRLPLATRFALPDLISLCA